MLTRYRELYNSLTHSKAFKPVGSMDNEKVNKSIFTPHNLKSIILGFNGFVAVYFTTNKADSKRVYAKPFYNQPRNDGDYKESLKETKGMIDALIDGYKFNFLEEIILFTGGFRQEDLNKEMQRIQHFVSHHITSFKRLSGIYRVDAVINDDLQNIVPNKSVVEQLKSIGLSVIPMIEQQVHRTELGLLERPGLDSSKYVLDSEYKPDLPDAEKGKEIYRLSKYFYDEEQQAIKARKAFLEKKAEQKKADEDAAKKAEEEQKRNVSRGYITALLQQGYKQIGNKEIVFGKENMASKILKWLESTCIERPNASTGYKYKTCYMNADELKNKGVMNIKDAVIWHPEIFTKSEDLMFRVFIRENEFGIEVLIKLPVGLNEFAFTQQANESVALLLSNTNAEKGKVYQSSIMDSPTIKSIRDTHQIDCVYDAIEFTLAKSLTEFAKSSWLFLDYLKACNGEVNAFSNFRNLPLGKKIVVGVKTNNLKTEMFDCSGQNQTSGLICGLAGSGKSALMDSLVTQFLALQGDFGNGAVVLMDAKQEWPPLWRAVFKEKGIPFYGFDGRYLSNQESLKKREVTDSGKVRITNFKETITQEVGGIMLMMALVEVIQGILEASGCKDVRSFNRSNKNIEGITRLPRIAIFIDEMNTYSANAQKGSVAQKIMPIVTNGANLTRTSGYMWFLCGQDIPRSILSSEKRGSFKYNIMGTMDRERYSYFDVDENPNVVAYEEKAATSENPHPIMKQGTFYAGVKGKTELVRSMFLPDEEKGTALDLLNSSFEGMYELDALVRYALNHNLFDNYTQGAGGLNNIIFATLRDIGVISDAEFEEATARIFSENTDEEDSADYWNDVANEGVDQETAKLNRKINEFEAEYNIVISTIEKDRKDLVGIPGKEKNEDKFNKLKSSILEKFDGIYRKKKEDFLKKIDKEVTDKELKQSVLQEYITRFNKDFNTYQQMISSMTFVIDDQIGNKDFNNPIDLNGNSGFNTDNRPQRPTRQQSSQSSQAYHQPQEQTQRTKNSIVKDRYTGKIEVKDNPFTKYINGTNVDTMLTVKDLTKIMIKDIRQHVCPDDMIKSFYITNNRIVINNIAYTPTFDDSFMSSLPMSLRVKVEQGQLAEFFDLGHIYHYRYLEDFRIYDEYLAQGRARKEMGIGFRKRWNVLFNKMDNLMFIKMGDVEYRRDNPDETAEASILDKFKNNESLTYAQGNRKTMMDRVWDSKPVRVMTGAFGWTMGVKMVWTLAALAGPWGLLFGAFAMAGAYKEIKKRQDTSQDNKSN